MINIGTYNELKIQRQTSFGLYLADEAGEEVLLPNKYCPENFELNDPIRVFVYLDSTEKKVATNIVPKITLNEFAFLKVNDVTTVGAFMDWGLEKDLLVPYREQNQKMEVGRWYLVYLELDTKTDRLYASNRIERVLQNEVMELSIGDEVDLIIYKKTDLGYKAIVNNKHKGLIFKNEIFKEINIGDRLKGFVKKIRDDNKLDITLQAPGFEKSIDSNTELIIQILIKNEGFIAVTDKSSPEEIYKEFGISKKAFKKAIGGLYKKAKIIIEDDGIKMIQKPEELSGNES